MDDTIQGARMCPRSAESVSASWHVLEFLILRQLQNLLRYSQFMLMPECRTRNGKIFIRFLLTLVYVWMTPLRSSIILPKLSSPRKIEVCGEERIPR